MKCMDKKPNVILFLTDDQGYWALGCSGNKEIRTPNIDRLAKEGIRFENFFCTSPVCSPARASILTGRIPSQHGIHDWIRGGNGNTLQDKPIEYLEGIPGYTDLMAQNGYTCGICGKWHLGAAGKPQKSYSHWFIAKQAGAGTYIDSDMFAGENIVPTKGYLTDIITDDAISFIEKCYQEEKPFYLNLAFTAPHGPLVDQHKQEYIDYYSKCEFMDIPQDPRHPWSPAHPVEIQYSESFMKKERERITLKDLLAGYYAAIQGVDDSVGRVMEKLEKLGIRENTLVIFMSDNGFSCGHHGIWGKGNATNPQNMYDTSVKVPCIFSMPGTIRENVINNALLSQYDFMPTLLDFLHISNSDAETLPGRSFLPTLLSEDEREYRESITVFDEYGPVRMIRTKTWKLIHRYPYGPDELYDLVQDPDEKHNLLDENRPFDYDPSMINSKVIELRAAMEKFFRQYTDPNKDGRVEPVCGRGQLCKVGSEAEGHLTFAPWVLQEYKR